MSLHRTTGALIRRFPVILLVQLSVFGILMFVALTVRKYTIRRYVIYRLHDGYRFRCRSQLMALNTPHQRAVFWLVSIIVHFYLPSSPS